MAKTAKKKKSAKKINTKALEKRIKALEKRVEELENKKALALLRGAPRMTKLMDLPK